MRRFLTCGMLLVLAVSLSVAEDNYPILVYPAQETKTAPKIDGKLDDACWKDKLEVSGFTAAQKLAQVQTSFRLTYDAHRVYLAVRCDEPKSDSLSPVRMHRDGNTWTQASIGFFISPKADMDYYQFFAAVSGDLMDASRLTMAWNSKAACATHIGKGYWMLELAAPWADLGIEPGKGTLIGFNVGRERYLGGPRETHWSESGNLHQPQYYANLVLSPTPEQIGKLSARLRRGGRTGPVCIFGPQDFALKSYHLLAENSLKGAEELFGALEDVLKKGLDKATQKKLTKLLATSKEKVRPYGERIKAEKKPSIEQYRKIGQDISSLVQELDKTLWPAVWEARLKALLASI